MATTYQCFFCRTTIDITSDEAMIVNVHRRIDEDEWGDDWFVDSAKDTFRFCSQAHLAQYMQQYPLPPPNAGVDADDDDWTVGDTVGCAVIVLLLVALLAGSVYGLVTLVSDLL